MQRQDLTTTGQRQIIIEQRQEQITYKAKAGADYHMTKTGGLLYGKGRMDYLMVKAGRVTIEQRQGRITIWQRQYRITIWKSMT